MTGRLLHKKCAAALFAALVLGCSYHPQTMAYAAQSAASSFSRTFLLTGDKTTDLISAALAQKERKKADLGYTESWCADFVGDCAYLVGASDVIPAYGSVKSFYERLLSAQAVEAFVPQAGDIVFYYCTETSTWVHCGIMIDGVQSIEGNYSGKVSLVKGIYRDSHGHSLAAGTVIRRFIRPAYSRSTADAASTLSDNPALGSATAASGTGADSSGTIGASGSGTTGGSSTSGVAPSSDGSSPTASQSSGTSTQAPSKKLYKKYAATYKVVTRTDPLTMRESPDTKSGILTSLPKGTKVKVTKATGSKKTDWALVTYKNHKGYLLMRYLKKVS